LIEALLGKFWKIPIIGDIAEEIKIWIKKSFLKNLDLKRV
jgi:uncharacterized membrane protein